MHYPSIISGSISTGLVTIGTITLNETVLILGGLAALSTLLLNIWTFVQKRRNKQ